MHDAARRITDYLIINNISSPDMREEHIYGFEILIGKILNYGSLLLLSYLNHNLVSTLCFMIIFFSLRGRTGGYHASKPLNCYIGTLTIYFLVTKTITPFLFNNILGQVVVIAVSEIAIFLYAPVNHPNLDLNVEEIESCKSAVRCHATLIMVCMIMAIFMEIIPVYITYAVAGMGMDAGLLLIAKILKTGGKGKMKKMKEKKEKILKAVVRVVESGVKSDIPGWPPPCIGYIYQPKRPKTIKNRIASMGDIKKIH